MSLRVKFLISLALPSIGLALYFLYFSVPQLNRKYIEQSRQHLESNLTNVAEGLFPLLSTRQLSEIYDNLNLIKARNPSWKYIQLNQADGQALYPLDEEEIPEKDLPANIIVERQDITHKNTHLGEIILIYDLADELQEFKTYKTNLLVAASALLLCFCIASTFCLEYFILKPITLISNASRALSAGNYESPLPRKNSDEVGQLIECFDSMRQVISSTQSKLLKALDNAEDAARTKGEFLATMNHELRTPLNGVMGMAQLLQTTELTKTQTRYASTILQSAESLLEILDDIFHYNQINKEENSSALAPFSLLETCELLVDSFSEEAHKKRIEFQLSYNSAVPQEFEGDERSISHILSNLISNAFKFTHDGCIHLCVELSNVPPKHEHEVGIRISVYDTGIGVADSIKDKIFDKFSQADSSNTRKFGGVGLGLAICKKLTTRIGGTIGVNSRAQNGAEFWLELSLKKSDLATAKPTHPLLNGLKIMVVDDVNYTRSAVADMLTSHGAQCAQFGRPEDALEALINKQNGEKAFDIAIIDYAMPGMNGLQMAELIQAQKASAPFCSIMLTAWHEPGLENKAKAVKIAKVLTKPVCMETLVNTTKTLYELEVVLQQGIKAEPFPQKISKSPLESQGYSKLKAEDELYVLLVEDDRINRELTAELLRRFGHKVLTAENGFQAINKVNELHFDVILMDCHMPEMDGYEATQVIMEMISRENIMPTTIIALTAYNSDKNREACLSAGMVDVIAKPIKGEELHRKLLKWSRNAHKAS